MLVYSQSRSEGRCDISLHSARRHIKALRKANIQSCENPKAWPSFNQKNENVYKNNRTKISPSLKISRSSCRKRL